MAAELHVLTGSRAGLVLVLSGAECTAGRHPACALCFAASTEHGVSARHAAFVRGRAEWIVRDLGSTNGTWLNGRRLSCPTVLREGDRIVLGADGPTLEFRLFDASGEARAPRRRRERPRLVLRAALAAAVAWIGGAVVAFHLQPHQAPPHPAPDLPRPIHSSDVIPASAAIPRIRERQPLQTPPDTAPPARPRPASRRRSTGEALGVIVPNANPRRVPASPAAPIADGATGAEMREQPARSLVIERRNRQAVARIWAEDDDGNVSTGTAFAVNANGTLITSRHVVEGRGGGPRRIAVQFAGSAQVWRARLLALSDEWDLAAVKVDGIAGDVPTVRGMNLRPDTLAPGSPIAFLGFSRGGDPVPGEVARPSPSSGAFAGVRRDRVEVFARSAAGASGSPLFDADGNVLGVLFGGDPRAPRPVLYGVPASAVPRLTGQAP